MRGAEGGNRSLANGIGVNLIQIGKHANWMRIFSISERSSFIICSPIFLLGLFGLIYFKLELDSFPIGKRLPWGCACLREYELWVMLIGLKWIHVFAFVFAFVFVYVFLFVRV